ncbi:mCG116241 [Mus musculus]|nr:mCG116241 [Mus musculus]
MAPLIHYAVAKHFIRDKCPGGSWLSQMDAEMASFGKISGNPALGPKPAFWCFHSCEGLRRALWKVSSYYHLTV